MSSVNRTPPFSYNQPPAAPAPASAQPGNAACDMPSNTPSNNAVAGQRQTAPPPLRKNPSFIATQLRKQLSQITLGIVGEPDAQESAALSPNPQGERRQTLSSPPLNSLKSLREAAAAEKAAENELATAAVQSCLDRLNQSKDLDETICHTSTVVVSKALCGIKLDVCSEGSLKTLEKEFKQHHKPEQKTVYRIDAPNVGHSFAVVRCGDKAVIVQSWTDNYSIKDWLEGTKTELSENPSLPKNGPVDITTISDKLNSISKSLKAGNVDAAHVQAKSMFNPFGPSATRMRLPLSFAKPGTGFTTKWSSAEMLNDGAPGAAH